MMKRLHTFVVTAATLLTPLAPTAGAAPATQPTVSTTNSCSVASSPKPATRRSATASLPKNGAKSEPTGTCSPVNVTVVVTPPPAAASAPEQPASAASTAVLAAAAAPAASAASTPAEKTTGPKFISFGTPGTLIPALNLAPQTALTPEARAVLDDTGCNRKGFWDTLGHPLNADCLQARVSQTSFINGAFITDSANSGNTLFVVQEGVQGSAGASSTVDRYTSNGNGWLLPWASVLGTFGSLYYAEKTYHLAKKTASGGSSGSGCANVYVNGNTTGNVTATCVTGGSTVVDSIIGAGNSGTISGNTNNVISTPTLTQATNYRRYMSGLGLSLQ